MDRENIKTFIKRLTIAWFLIGFLLAGAAFGGLMPLEIFQWSFAGGFIIYVIITSVLTQMLHNGK